ncbi:SusD family protein [Mariniflexile rhizosphaerae]|uniref:RagB/SusD family nutrient uptake outer membrane protein n=1 Tax=unclassified Mariniflexile TaxID=2643887 RepID=UPI000E32F5BB|nr:RagB/SusD family nutrient uptake outer membrane protein [Mariniflexile sp. TRM1-10]AXP82741.1 SusD family protein [Mariniflexile sp. TRM1-10]
MNNINTQIKYWIITAAFICLIACDSFTEVDAPNNQIVSSQVFTNKSGAESALADIYARIREEGVVTGNPIGGTVIMANYSDDLIFFGSNTTLQQFSNHTLIPSNTYINTIWRTTYSHIYAINAFKEGVVNSVNITEEDKSRFLGEALFLRAFLHFYLVNSYGQIPYITSTDYIINKNISKKSETEIHSLILQDLTEAKELIPDNYPTSERVRPNKSVVNSLLARVYLYNQDWQNAQDYASAVIENQLYSWQEDIDQEFLRNNPSIIWSLHPGIAGLNTRDARSFVFASGPPSRSTLAPDLYTAFEPNDLRRTSWIKEIQGSGETWYHANKYKKITNTGISEEYTILFRLAEMHLIRAECKAMVNDLEGAKEDINKIRNRAGLTDTNEISQQDLLQAILNERRLEFFTEQSHRFFDLKRTGKANEILSIVKPNWRPTNVVFPLPENELLLNENLLPQNLGY